MGACCTMPKTPRSSRSNTPEYGGPIVDDNPDEESPLYANNPVMYKGVDSAPIVTITVSDLDVKTEAKPCGEKAEPIDELAGHHRLATTRAALKGNLSAMQRTKLPKIYICLMGLDKDSNTERLAVEQFLHTKIKNVFDERPLEVVIINLNLQYICPDGYSALEKLEHFLIDEVNNSMICRIVFVNELTGRPAPPTSMLKSDFSQTLPKTDPQSKQMINDYYGEDPSDPANKMRLKPKKVALSDKEPFDKYNQALQNCSNEYWRLLDAFKACYPQDIQSKYLRSELERMADSSYDYVYGNKTIMVNRKLTRMPGSCNEMQIYLNGNDDQNEKLNLVKDKLRTKTTSDQIFSFETTWENIGNEKAYLNPLRTKLYDCLEKIFSWKPLECKIQVNNCLEDNVKISLLEEIHCHAEHCRQLVSEAKDIDDHLSKIKQYLNNESNQWLILTGSHSLLSEIVASAISKCEGWRPDAFCLFRFVDLTTASSLPEGLFHSLFQQATLLLGVKGVKLKRAEPLKNFGAILDKATPQTPLVIFIDAITNLPLDGWKEAYTCLPEKLPSHVKLIVSGWEECLSLKRNAEVIKVKEKVAPAADDQETKLEFCKDRLEMLNMHLKQCGTDLLIRSKIFRMLSEIEDNFFKPVVKDFFACLALANVGLTDHEAIRIFERQYGKTPLAVLDYIRLMKTLRTLLKFTVQNGVRLFTWRDELYRKATEDRYLEGSNRDKYVKMMKDVVLLCHDGNFPVQNMVKDDEVLVRRCGQEVNSIEIAEKKNFDLLFDPQWLMFTLENCCPFQIIKDINMALKQESTKELLLLKEFFVLSAWSLEYEAKQLFTQLHGRLGWKMKGLEKNCPKLFALLKVASEPPISTLKCTASCIAQSLQHTKVYDSGDPIIDGIFRIPQDAGHVISISSTRGEVIVWKITNFDKVRTLKGINEPKNLKMIDSEKCLLLCGRELRVYNLNDGTLLTKLRELMNQKSPFFGLHDHDHPVTLSRSRMYVNMTNIVTNKCDTTFKVGEDRFLNSLIVSGNGKICVCGDESKKPNSILVWNLETRKLLYDLKMPSHDFNTLIMAITYEGNYLCCVSDEIDEAGPNFVVVYDLQSGTIFKRWKPGPNTESIGVSSESSCVIVSLDNSSNMAWDLKSGTTRWAVDGHTAPADVLKIDDSGKYLLSWDSSGRDGSVRLWSMETGKVLGTVTPDQRITACELSNEGDRVFLGLDGESDLFSFEIYDKNRSSIVESEFGSSENAGKVFDLGQAQAST